MRTVRHPGLPPERIVCRAPLLVGTSGAVECGFVVFLEGGTLTIECHTWDGSPLPHDLRKRPVRIERAR